MNAAIQTALVALLLAWSLGVMLRRWFPAGTAALLARWAGRIEARGLPRLARWLAPDAGTSAGCDSNCGSCRTGCASDPVDTPVQWRQPSPSGHSH
ncbi:MAG: hypothetical protein K0S16_750 [Moraxellaceae bacterium]|nr:hypothetical protein [Moraxellaceae bacterium]